MLLDVVGEQGLDLFEAAVSNVVFELRNLAESSLRLVALRLSSLCRADASPGLRSTAFR